MAHRAKLNNAKKQLNYTANAHAHTNEVGCEITWDKELSICLWHIDNTINNAKKPSNETIKFFYSFNNSINLLENNLNNLIKSILFHWFTTMLFKGLYTEKLIFLLQR